MILNSMLTFQDLIISSIDEHKYVDSEKINVGWVVTKRKIKLQVKVGSSIRTVKVQENVRSSYI